MRLLNAPILILLLFSCGYKEGKREVFVLNTVEVGFELSNVTMTTEDSIPIIKPDNFNFKLRRRDSVVRIDFENIKVRNGICAVLREAPSRTEYEDFVINTSLSSNLSWGSSFPPGSSLNGFIFGRATTGQLPVAQQNLPFSQTLYLVNPPAELTGKCKLYVSCLFQSGKILKDSTELFFEQ